MIFIPGNVPSSKNSKQWTGKYLVHSKPVQRYIKESEYWYQKYREVFLESVSGLEKPYVVGFHFTRNSKRKYDWVNPLQTVQDLMVKHGWLEDDNSDILIPMPFEIGGNYSSYSSTKPGVSISIEPAILKIIN